MTLDAPRLALGTMHFGTKVSQGQAHEILDAYLEAGGQWIDTANCYAFWSSESGLGGQSETVIGRWLQHSGRRERVKLSTKVGAEPSHPGGYPDAVEGLSQSVVRDSLSASLERLHTDHVDMFWAHKEDRSQSIESVTDAFSRLVATGKTAQIGLSNHPAWYLAAANTYAAHTGQVGFSAAQLRESYLHPRPDIAVAGQDHPNGMMTPETKDYAEYTGLELWAYTPLLTGTYEHPDRPLADAYDHPGTYARLQVLQTWARELGMKPSQVVLAWLLAQRPRITPIVGVSSTAQVHDAIAAAKLELPAEALSQLNAA